MAIVKLKPSYKDYIWGGTRLKEDYGKVTDLDIVAESWELSVHPDGESVIASGDYSGKTLSQYIRHNGTKVLGTKGESFENFPILIKFIDAAKSLSIQVHPSDDYALEKEKEYGKTEMWYIMDCKPGAKLYYGVNKEIDKEEFERRIKDNTLTDVLKAVDVHKGDVFFIPSGTIHAIGEGIQICEIQQNSNSTYRVYDFGRVGKDGKPRPLHIDKAIDVSNLKPVNASFKPCGNEFEKGDAQIIKMAACEKFTTYVVKDEGETFWNVDDESFGSIVVLDGSLSLNCKDESLDLNKGDTAFIDAGSGKINISGEGEFIFTRV